MLALLVITICFAATSLVMAEPAAPCIGVVCGIDHNQTLTDFLMRLENAYFPTGVCADADDLNEVYSYLAPADRQTPYGPVGTDVFFANCLSVNTRKFCISGIAANCNCLTTCDELSLLSIISGNMVLYPNWRADEGPGFAI